MPTELMQPVVNDGIRLTHFFNGRVLTAEDLRREQDALRDRHRGLAGAVGEGVVRGLEVRAATSALPTPSVWVSAGLAFNRDGDPVLLPRPIELRLIPANAAATEPDAGLFGLCERPGLEARVDRPGFYLLTARPASAHSGGRVPYVDLESGGVGAGCGSRYTEQGASFSLVALPLPAGTAQTPLAAELNELAAKVDTATGGGSASPLALARMLSQLRNGMAYWCAGEDHAADRLAGLAVPTFAAPAVPLSPLDELRESGALASCDVPLALLYVTARRLEWVDMWAVRRVPTPLGADAVFAAVTGRLPTAEAAAQFMQFRDHAATFFANGSPAAPETVRARDWFLYLPPAGVLPVRVFANDRVATPGFEPGTFFDWFGELPERTVPADWVLPLVDKSLQDIPSRLRDNPGLRMYRFERADGSVQPYLMFRTRRWLPSRVIPQ